jgi:hypothetical protein
MNMQWWSCLKDKACAEIPGKLSGLALPINTSECKRDVVNKEHSDLIQDHDYLVCKKCISYS